MEVDAVLGKLISFTKKSKVRLLCLGEYCLYEDTALFFHPRGQCHAAFFPLHSTDELCVWVQCVLRLSSTHVN
jgi:hypothetical protein